MQLILNIQKKIINLIDGYQLDRFDNRRFKKNNKNIKKATYYKVKKGDTLFSISKKYNISIKDLVKNNYIKDNTIYLGQELKVNTQNK